MSRIALILLLLVAFQSDAFRSSLSAAAGETGREVPPVDSGKNQAVRRKVVTCVPVLAWDLQYGGTIAGPDGELADGSRRVLVLRLKSDDGQITVEHPGSGFNPETDKPYRFVLQHDLKTDAHTLLEVWDGDHRVLPAYRFQLKKPGDSVAAVPNADAETFVVTSQSGIGGATISLTGGQWPKRVAIRFRYGKEAAGRGFTNLEQFHLVTNRLRVEGSLCTSGRMRFGFLDSRGRPAVIQPRVAEPAGSLNVTVEQREGGILVTLPDNLPAGSRTMTLNWIDAFRQ